jgi:PDZ domain-containing secreted protein
MGFDRKWLPAALALGGILICSWCSLLSGAGGWFVGGDIAAREARLHYDATATAGSNLPPLGVLVTRLDRGGPADRAGVLRGDVIVKVDGVDVQDARDLHDALMRLLPGKRTRLTIDRGDGPREVQVDLAAFPDDPRRAYMGIYFTARAEEPADL